jgi:uncharacterized membrane protein
MKSEGRFAHMKKYLITGLLIWIPVVITIWVLDLIVTTMDQTLTFIPADFKPQTTIPGLGLLLTLVVVYLTGLFTSNFLGRRVMQVWEGILRRIPVVNSIYGGVKQVSDTLFTPGGQAFRKAVLVQYPRPGSWTIAFLTGQPGGDVANHLNGDYVSVYVPTTPNPTSGFFLMMLRSEVVELDMSVDEALKYVVSMGVVPPRSNGRKPVLPATNQ